MGRLARVDRRILFEYSAEFLADPLPLSPAQLPPRPGVFEEPKHIFEGLHGVFDDSLPDGWGRLLLDRELDRVGIGRGSVGPMDRLAFVGEDGPGALIYRPSARDPRPSGAVELRRLADEARQVIEGDEDSMFPELLALGGSSGGARPKVLVDLNPDDGRVAIGRLAPTSGFVPAIVKFAARDDPADIGAIELAYARMAISAGIDMSRTWLVGANAGHPGWFATERFDRPRVHVHSLAGLLHATHRAPSLDYEGTLRATRWLTRDQAAVDEMYRRMVFNVLTHNRDDHSKNFAFRLDGATWRLAPAFDLTFSNGPGGEHWMTVAGEGRAPTQAHLLAVAERTGVDPEHARELIDCVRDTVSRWPRLAEEAGVSRRGIERIARALETVWREGG